MSVFRPRDCVSYRYDFSWRGKRYTGNTWLTTRDEAKAFEDRKRLAVRRRAARLGSVCADKTPTFPAWTEVVLKYKWQTLKRPEELELTLRMVLGFWGRLCIGDPIRHPDLLDDFERWMDARRVSESRKKQYRSACSVLYRVAALPAFRKRSGVTSNPFEDTRPRL